MGDGVDIILGQIKYNFTLNYAYMQIVSMEGNTKFGFLNVLWCQLF